MPLVRYYAELRLQYIDRDPYLPITNIFANVKCYALLPSASFCHIYE